MATSSTIIVISSICGLLLTFICLMNRRVVSFRYRMDLLMQLLSEYDLHA